ncbi:Nramp family divalent metal transporter [Dietzia cinnamea]|uniref:Nramp family divalent metal transporter n=1 Tax=Dietzia sp. oral taxon 368 TaxID=712270 RepID=UPI001F0786D4|nr:Nramp family divalent metal transporter [Dietzia sp. oral taxon 368]MCT1713253.1 Nramp family divalent metal transporter [Dietzia cinnamea]MCT2057416.1 Nramp family divalent metal transporter [Dietzia cinnamea]MCT2097441.1 Nramp family divalent metal transporter [Dietzia cinnamea]MCT2122369.1 Nramp family divalent metal transporter [Dietzia cinnamea]MCT2146501.1 Nramp family divalent metal transporter [Dietzia cinnamea]
MAYLDPGNVAVNMSAGAQFGYLLVWVLVAANAAAWLVQYLSAKLGLVTGSSMAELLGQRIANRAWRVLYGLQAQCVAIATDVAEVIGGAVALWILFDVPLVAGAVITGVISTGLLLLQAQRGARTFEFAIIGLMLVIVIGFCYGLFIAPPEPGAVLGGMIPRFDGAQSVLLAASILGATVMPHAIYAHSSLARDRFGTERTYPLSRLIRATRVDVTIALTIAGSVNLVMLLVAASVLPGVAGTETIEGAHAAIENTLGTTASLMFAIALLASGLASTAVGAYAGSDIMGGLFRTRMKLLTRRLITIIPSIIVLAAGVDPTYALILSQVILSFGIPFALVPLVWLTSRKSLMGASVNARETTFLGWAIAAVIIALNVALVALETGIA